MANHLAREKSPYLQQHASHPVDWYPWSEEAFARARREDKPVFLSIGYATCHWCHVMARESFQDLEVAELLNRHFVCVKVDREERPDIDQVYLAVCQALTGTAGWPLTIFLTPDQKPFYAATYLPKHTQPGRPGLMELGREIARLWREDRQRLVATGEQIVQALRPKVATGQVELDLGTLEEAYWALDRAFDRRHGGFGRAPKFPSPSLLLLLLRWHTRQPHSRALEMVTQTLRAMRRGGICDQLGFGYHRYSVDRAWRVPHFEKMLYDQALIALVFLEAFQVTGEERLARGAREIFTYVERELTAPQGGFYTAEDAESQGQEGLYYLWTPEEVSAVLGRELGELACRRFGVTPEGNFPGGGSVPHLARRLSTLVQSTGLSREELRRRLEEVRHRLLAARDRRPRPEKDDKVLTADNGLMIVALATAAQALGDHTYYQTAEKAADFVLEHLVDDAGRLLRRWRQGEAVGTACLEDYAFMIWGLIELYQAGLHPRHLQEALHLAGLALEQFWDEMYHGFYFTPHYAEPLVLRPKDLNDGATPSANGTMACNLLRLSQLTGNPRLRQRAAQLLEAFSAQVARTPAACAQLLTALDLLLGPTSEVVVAGLRDHPATDQMLAVVQRHFLPRCSLALRSPDEEGELLARLAPYTAEMSPAGRRPVAYLCRGGVCQTPLEEPAALREQLLDPASLA